MSTGAVSCSRARSLYQEGFNSFLQTDVQEHLAQIFAESDLHRLCSLLSKPPLFTVLRVNTTYFSREVAKEKLIQVLATTQLHREEKQWEVFEHPLLDDVLWIPFDKQQSVLELPKKVVVDLRCGESVLRGADVYAPGVLAAPTDLQSSDKVSVYTDASQNCRRGNTQMPAENAVFVGNGCALMSRRDLFSDQSKNSGVAVVMTCPVFPAPSLSGVLPDTLFLQNLPSVVVTHVLAPQCGDCILDMCASPGGKTTHIAARMRNEGTVVALDKTQPKIDKIHLNLTRLQLSCVQLYKYDGRNAFDINSKAQPRQCDGPPYGPSSFDRILVDAPCSGLGQRPQLMSRLSLGDLQSFPNLQKALLTTAFHLLKPSGVLVYCTCTLTPEENEQQVAWLLRKFPELTLVKQEPYIGRQGLPGHGLIETERQLIQRFDPLSTMEAGSGSSQQSQTPSLDSLHSDTIGFFIACFVKSIRALAQDQVTTQL